MEIITGVVRMPRVESRPGKEPTTVERWAVYDDGRAELIGIVSGATLAEIEAWDESKSV